MKDVLIDEAIRRDKKLLESVERATELLEEVIGPRSFEVTARWSLEPQEKKSLPRLEVSDASASSSLVFSEEGLSRVSRFGLRLALLSLWGELLEERSHQQMARLRMVVQSLDSE